jgi:DNA polymerase II small subunit
MDEAEASTVAKNVLIKVSELHGENRIITKNVLLEFTSVISVPAQAPVAVPIPSKQISPRVEVVRDPSREIGTGGSVEDFRLYFRDRFEKLAATIRDRPDARDAVSIMSALKLTQNAKVKIIGMITSRREREGRLFLELEDLEDSVTVLVSAEERAAYDAAQKLPLDQVVCVDGVRAKGDLIVAKHIVLPDIPDHKPHVADEEVWAVLLSDFHVGSKKFLAKQLTNVFDWLNLRIGSPQQRKIAERTKYVVVCGDIVDGIGIYPRQEQELAIVDLYEQYREAAKYVEMIPDYIETIILPGNHDAVRQALPQPCIPKDFGEPLYEARELISVGNPAEVTLHNVRLLLHHGRSLDDIIAGVPNMDFTQPEKAMRLQLQCRHLASEYGKRTSIAPEKADHLVIENVPDIFQSGHIHVAKFESYRGTQIVNSGAWQSQTDYQRRAGLVPTPGILTVVNLRTLQVYPINFMDT